MMTNGYGPAAQWREALQDGRFLLQRSSSSGKCIFPPRVAEPGTGANDLEWVEASGRGTVYAVTTIRLRPPANPYNVVLVDLDEGPRMMSRVETAGDDPVEIGLRVTARIAADGDEPMVLFAPADDI